MIDFPRFVVDYVTISLKRCAALNECHVTITHKSQNQGAALSQQCAEIFPLSSQ
jgi:hypothetical protein